MQRKRLSFLARAAMTLLVAMITVSTARAEITGSGNYNDPYVLNTAEDWATFAEKINDGSYFNKYYKLSDTWDNSSSPVTVTVGTKDHPFTGTFEGNGKTLYVNINDTENEGTAPFREFNRLRPSGSYSTAEARIRNLTVRGSVTGSTYAAGLVGICKAYNAYSLGEINNCTVDVNVIVPGTSADATMGGVVGYSYDAGLSITNTTFSGTLDNKANYAGGLIGSCEYSCNFRLKNCLFKGSYKGSAANGFHPIGILGGSKVSLFSSCEFSNCFYTQDPTLTDASNIIYSGTRVYASADDIDNDLLKKNLYELVKASDNEQYYAPAAVNGLGTVYKYTGSAIALGYTVNAFDGTVLSKGTHYSETFKRDGSVVSEVKEKGNYTLAITGVIPGNTIEFSFGVVDAENVVNLGNITSATTIPDNTILTGTLTSNVKVSIAAGATVTLYNATINGINKSDYMFAGLTCEGDATLILADGTTNTVTGFERGYPAIQVAHNSGSGDEYTLTIRGNGSLNASTSYISGWTGAAIGGNINDDACGNIVIEGGNITANCGNTSAAIGSAYYKKCGNITISGGTINASASFAGSGIGSASSSNSSCGNITISGGDITASGGDGGTGIGSGSSGICGNILICGGTVTALSVGIHGVGIGCAGNKGVCGNITITQDAYCVSSTRGSYARNSVGRDYNYEPSTIGTVTVGCTLDAQGNPVGGKVGEVSDESFKFYGSVATNVLNTVIISGIKDHYCYNGSPIDLDFALTDLNGNVLKQGTDYTVTLNGTDVTDQTTISIPDLGNYTLAFEGIGNYSGENSVSFFVCDLSNIKTEFTFVDGDVISGKYDTREKLSIADGATVTLNGVNIVGGNYRDYLFAGLTCEGDATIILADGTENTIRGFEYEYPGIQISEGKTLTIKGNGSLSIDQTFVSSAAIGGVYGKAGGNIVIQGGNIVAKGGSLSAGIGASTDGSCGDITITGGNIIAEREKYGEYSIGGANAGTVTIGNQVTGSIKDNVHIFPYTVSFDANGGSGAAMKTMSFMHDIPQTLTANTYSAPNASDSFVGWSTAADGKLMFEDGVSVNNLTETPGADVTLYALWHPNVDESAGLSVDNDYTYPAEGHFFVDMPATGAKTVTIPTTVPSFKIYDNGGKDGKYSPSCDGTLVLNAPEGCIIQLTGKVNIYNTQDYLSVYDGNEASGTPLLDQKKGVDSSIGIITSKTQNMTLCFSSDDVDYSVWGGLDLTVRVIKANAENEITVKNPTDGGSVAASLAESAAATAPVHETVSLTATASTGYLLSDLSVVDGYNNNVSTTDMLWYTGKSSATFTMPGSEVTVTPTFTNTLTAEGGLYINLPETGTKTVDLSSFTGLKSFKVYDDGGKDGHYSNLSDGTLVLTAPEGCKLELSGTILANASTYLYVYDGTSNEDTQLLRKYTYEDTPVSIGSTITSSGRSLTINFKGESRYTSIYDGIDLLVKIINPDDEQKIVINNPTEGGSLSGKGSAKLDETVTLTNNNDDGYYLTDISVKDANNEAVELDWQGSFFNTSTFKMMGGEVTVTPTYTNNLTADGGLFVKMPATGDASFKIPADVQSFKVYNDGGKNHVYSHNCNGTLTMIAPKGYELKVSGSVRIADRAYLEIYDGTESTDSKKQISSYTYKYGGIDPVVSSTGSLTFRFTSKDYTSTGADLTVTLIDVTAKQEIAIKDVEGGIIAASVDNTTVTEAAVNETVTLTATLDDGSMLDGISVVAEDNSTINVTDARWFCNTNQATFTMPAAAVAVTPSYTKAKTAEDGLYINMQNDVELDVTIPDGVQSFKVYDNGGKDGNYDKKHPGTMVLTAPEGYVLQLSGEMKASSSSHLMVYNGTTKDDPLLLDLKSESYFGSKEIGSNLISGRSMLINFAPTTYDSDREGLDLTVTLINSTAKHEIAISDAEGGKVNVTVDKASATAAKVNETITLTSTAADGHCLSNITVMDADKNLVNTTGDIVWYESTNQFSFIMPGSAVTVTPTYIDKVTADDGWSINMPANSEKTINLSSYVQSFNVYSDRGRNESYSNNCDGTLTLSAPKDFKIKLTGESWVADNKADHLYIYDGKESKGTQLFNGKTGDVDINVVSGSDMTLHFVSGTNHYTYHRLRLVAQVGNNVGIASGIEHGVVECTDFASNNETVKLTLTPDEGYTVDKVFYNDGTDHEILPSNDEYSFLMPAKDVTVSATFKLIEYAINYEGVEDATFDKANSDSYTIEDVDLVLNNPTKAGYEFAGWTGTGLDAATETVTIKHGTTGELTYTATWTENVLELANTAEDNTLGIEEAANSGKIYNRVILTGRTLYKDGDWNTICLPFDVTIAKSPLADAKVMKLDDLNSGLNGKKLTLNFVEETDVMTAGTPYLVKWTKADDYDQADPETRDLKAPVFQGVTITGETNNIASYDKSVAFIGTYNYISIDKEDENTILLGANNKLYYPQPDLSDVQNPKYPSIGAFRAYFRLYNNDFKVKEFQINFSDDDTEDGIKNVNVNDNDNSIFNLAGQKVGRLQKGVNIVNGKKIFVK